MALPRRAKSLRTLGFALLAGLAVLGRPAAANDKPGDFDYWVLALSWAPQYCKSEPADEQCMRADGFVVHGLWPQNERGYPDYCGKREQVPKTLVDRMLPLMPSEKLIQYQWRKHGNCSGMAMEDYFLNVERAWRSIAVPTLFRNVSDHVETDPDAIEASFLEVNPKLGADGIALQCRGRWLNEVRICLDRDFQPRSCGTDVEDRCRSQVHIRPLRDRTSRRP